MIHDIAPHQYDVSYKARKANADDTVLVFYKNGLLCHMDGNQMEYPSIKDMEDAYPTVSDKAEFLFHMDGKGFFMLWENEDFAYGKWNYVAKEALRSARPIFKAFAGIIGFQIYKWRTETVFCGCCGTKMRPHEKERAMRCQACGRVSYPQICPGVIVGVTNGEQILMTKYAQRHSSFKKYALVAGYAEVGESLEDTVRREVMEEVGLKVRNIRYYKSQPWPFTDALLIGFFCDLDGDSEIVMDREELSEAVWFERKNLPIERSEAEISLTGEMIEAFQNGIV